MGKQTKAEEPSAPEDARERARPESGSPGHADSSLVTDGSQPFSILALRGESGPEPVFSGPPPFFRDLNLDQVVASITTGWEEYHLERFFSLPLTSLEDVAYRQAVQQDLEQERLRAPIERFSETMRAVHKCRQESERLRAPAQKWSMVLEAAERYCDALGALHAGLAQQDLRSLGLRRLQVCLAATLRSSRFQTLSTEAAEVREALSHIQYALLVEEGRVTVDHYHGEPDYTLEIERTFQRFRESEAKNYLVKFHDEVQANSLEEVILDHVVQLFPPEMASLERFAHQRRDFLDHVVDRFYREVQFYLAYLSEVERLRGVGLSFCYPQVAQSAPAVFARDSFDLALAQKSLRDRTPVVVNDFALTRPERILVVSGPNQGGKTTFARMIGQVHYLACLGLAVPGREARLAHIDGIFTHFERREHIEELQGKILDELTRVHEILKNATDSSLLIFNETFSSTSAADALVLGEKVLDGVLSKGALAVYVTFLDELSRLGEGTVSMVAAVDPRDPAQRTFKILRQAADGKAYALTLAEKHGLTYAALHRRFAE